MKILLIQSKGGHVKNREFREALCLKRSLNKIENINAIVWGKCYENFNIPFSKMMDYCDVALLVENYPKGGWLPDMTVTKKLKLFWSVDSHIVFKRHLQTAKNNKINIVLSSTFSYLKAYKGYGMRCCWFPNCYPSDLIKPISKVKKMHDVGFCGNYVNRKKWIDILARSFNFKKDIFVIGQDMVKAINSYKIHFNKNYSKDINYRTFETLGCQTVLITNNTDRLKDLFTIGKHLVVYNNIAKAGYQHVKKHHTYDNRAIKLVKIIKENI